MKGMKILKDERNPATRSALPDDHGNRGAFWTSSCPSWLQAKTANPPNVMKNNGKPITPIVSPSPPIVPDILSGKRAFVKIRVSL